MSENNTNPLEQIANELIDSLRVNWQKADSLSKDEKLLLQHFNTISQVAQIHQAQQVTNQTSQSQHSSQEPSLFTWGRLSVIESIGKGAFGEVYRAYDAVLDRNVALKLLKKELTTPINSRTFIGEAKRLAKVRHPNVLAIHGANIHEGRAGFWADLIDGKSLDEVQQNGYLDFGTLFKITQQISQGLDAIHHAGIIHGDIKPANLMQDERGDYLIMDFGAGIYVEELEQFPGYIQGTPALMAPELFAQKHEGTATDIYAFGATLFKLATDKYPVQGKDLLEIQRAHKNKHYKRLSALRPDLPMDFLALIQSMVVVGANRRPDTQSVIKALYDIETAPQRRRNKLAIWSIIGLLIAGTAVSTWGFYQANEAKNTAIEAQNNAETVNAFLQDMLAASAELGGGREVRVADVLDQASDKIWAEPPGDTRIELEMHQSLAHSYNALDDMDKSLKHAQKSMSLAKDLYKPKNEKYIRSQLELIAALETNKQHQASIDLAKQLIEQAEPTLGTDHWYIQKARKYIITNSFALSKFDDAIVILDKYFQQVPDPKTAVNNFGFEIWKARSHVYFFKGDFSKAVSAAEQGIAWLEAYPRKSLLNVRGITALLGMAQLEKGMIDEGASTLEKVLELTALVYGEDNNEYVEALVNLGAAQRLKGKPELAMKTTLQAYELSKSIYGEEKNLITVGIGTNLANMLVDLGDVKQGEKVMRESLDMAHQVLGSDKPKTLILEYNLAELLNNQGHYNEALEYAISTHAKMIDVLGENHPFVFLSLDNWAISLRGIGQMDLALEKHHQAVEGIVAVIGKKHQYTLLVRQHQMDTVIAAGMISDNIEKLNQLVTDLTEVHGENNESTQRFKQLLERQ